MKNYRITFCGKDEHNKKYDVAAENRDDAFSMAYQMPEAKQYHLYSGVMVEEIPEKPSVIGLRFQYQDTVFKKTFYGYLHILAKDEAAAVDFYNRNYRGGRFMHDVAKTEANGKCIRGEVVETFFSGCPGYCADATA